MGSPYKYRLRPGFVSGKLLLEFILDSPDKEFENDLMATLRAINPRIDAIHDLWMNDEMILEISSDEGPFWLSKDTWDLAFITTHKNQSIIKRIDALLSNSALFEKEDVDFEDYKGLKR